MSGANPRRPAIQAIDQLLWKIHELEETVSDFRSPNQELLERRINEYVDLLAALRGVNHLLADDVPLDLLRFMDDGANPDAFTRDMFSGALEANQMAKGRVVAFEGFRGRLGEAVGLAYPEGFARFKGVSSAKRAPWAAGEGGKAGTEPEREAKGGVEGESVAGQVEKQAENAVS